MDFKEILQTKNLTKGVNTKEFIVVHHTGTPPGTTKGNLNVLLGNTKSENSAHFLVSDSGDVYRLAKDDDITHHAGVSEWKGKKGLNSYSIGIEVIGPVFNDLQREKVGELILYLSKKYNISKANILRHKDITTRKVDIDDSFWNQKFTSWDDYKNYLFTKNDIMGEFAKNEGFELFTSSPEDYKKPATIGDVKDLMETAVFRYHEQNKNGILKKRKT